MLALWSRTLQAPSSSCRCRICHSANNALVRRSTTTAPTRKFTVADVFTACYTTILGTAAIIDAQRKDARRKELDHQLECARNALQDATTAPVTSDISITNASTDTDKKPVIYPAHRHQERTQHILSEVASLCRSYQRPLHDPSLWRGNHFDWIAIQAAIVAEERNVPQALREPQSEDHIRRTTLAIIALVDRLMQEIQRTDAQRKWHQRIEELKAQRLKKQQLYRKYPFIYSANQASRTKASAAAILQKIQDRQKRAVAARRKKIKAKIKSRTRDRQAHQPQPRAKKTTPEILDEVKEIRDGVQYPSYHSPHNDPQRTKFLRAALNESIRRIFNKQLAVEEKVGLICYNLLTVSAPPTIHTFNNLIAGFNGMRRSDLAQIVVDSFLNRTKWPATDQTVVCLLKHHETPNGLQGLRDLTQRMRGAHEDGLHYGIFNREHDRPVHPDFVAWASKYCARRKRAFVLRTFRTDAVYDSLIQAWLYHNKTANACLAFVASLRNGAFITAETFHTLLQNCMAGVDSISLRRLIKGIFKNFSHFQVMLEDITQSIAPSVGRNVVSNLFNILNLLSMPIRGIGTNYFLIHRETSNKLREVLKRIDRQFRIRESIDLSAQLIKIFNTEEPSQSKVEGALAVLQATRKQQAAAYQFSRSFSSTMRVYNCTKRVNELERNTRNLIAAVTSMTFLHRIGFDCDPKSLLLTDQREELPWRKRTPSHSGKNTRVLRHALGHVDVLNDSLSLTTAGDAGKQLARRIPDQHLRFQLEKTRGWGLADMGSAGLKTLMHFLYPTAFTRQPRSADLDDMALHIQQLDDEVQMVSDTTRAILFASLRSEFLMRDIMVGPGYYNIQLGLLAALHHRRFRVLRAWFKGKGTVDNSQDSDPPDAQPTTETETLAVDRWAHSFGSEQALFHEGTSEQVVAVSF
ncbi:hypothetical protein F5Y16DRAFT_190070 [Xylariaceae sp. FL0255]|nr:hypothetical protein F5Y16DRAFT_190070 [Xylariaceae sp. FL0255]